jgi:histidine phosphotransfer protein HptB
MRQLSYDCIDPLVLFRAVERDLSAFRALSQTALRDGAAPALAHACHALRGTTVLVGAVQLTAILHDMETAARAGAAEGGMDQLPELTRLFEQILREVRTSIVAFQGLAEQAPRGAAAQ